MAMQRLKEAAEKAENIDFSIEILKERKNTLTNCYSPLYEKISKTINELKLLKEEK